MGYDAIRDAFEQAHKENYLLREALENRKKVKPMKKTHYEIMYSEYNASIDEYVDIRRYRKFDSLQEAKLDLMFLKNNIRNKSRYTIHKITIEDEELESVICD